MGFDLNSAKKVVEAGMNEAQDLIRNPSKVDDLLIQLEEALRQIPVAGDSLADIPLMISMVKSYITKEYTEVSMKVIITLISAFIYVVKKKDIISDAIPVVGQLDDLAVLKFAMTFVRPELDAYSKWRAEHRDEAARAAAAGTRATEPDEGAEAAAAGAEA